MEIEKKQFQFPKQTTKINVRKDEKL